ncbi:MAG: hypothetical protein BGO49_08390 [Planctomycetales bacterium 71-10]|nr:MAG: hypothetical protein BGO49_08390 [Planctomycetales bacterium 71-10]
MTRAPLVVLAGLLAWARSDAARAHDHRDPAPVGCECAVCIPVPTTKKSTTYEYQTKDVTRCYVRPRFDLFRRFHHEPPAAPEVVPTRRRVLMKREVVKGEPTVKYEAKTFAVPCPAHQLERCRTCHGG